MYLRVKGASWPRGDAGEARRRLFIARGEKNLPGFSAKTFYQSGGDAARTKKADIHVQPWSLVMRSNTAARPARKGA